MAPDPVSGSGGFLEGKRDTIMALTPFAALLLFFATYSWLWFLLIPVMGIVLYGAGGKKTRRIPAECEPARDTEVVTPQS